MDNRVKVDGLCLVNDILRLRKQRAFGVLNIYLVLIVSLSVAAGSIQPVQAGQVVQETINGGVLKSDPIWDIINKSAKIYFLPSGVPEYSTENMGFDFTSAYSTSIKVGGSDRGWDVLFSSNGYTDPRTMVGRYITFENSQYPKEAIRIERFGVFDYSPGYSQFAALGTVYRAYYKADITYKNEGIAPPTIPERWVEHSNAGTEYSLRSIPYVAGYTFTGWSTSDISVVSNKFTVPARDVTFTGYWEPVQNTPYTVEIYKEN